LVEFLSQNAYFPAFSLLSHELFCDFVFVVCLFVKSWTNNEGDAAAKINKNMPLAP